MAGAVAVQVITGITAYLQSIENSYTFVSNLSGKDVVVSVGYKFLGKEGFKNRTIKAHGGHGKTLTGF